MPPEFRGRDSVVSQSPLLRRYLGDRRFLLTLPRAVTLQMLNPQIAGALNEHMPTRLWDHKKRVVSQIIYMAYSGQVAEPVIRGGHEHVKGVGPTGARYHALRPELFFFQHATFVDTLVTSINLFSDPLSAAQHHQLYDECCLWYESYGISMRAMPARWPEFVEYFADACATQLTLTEDNAALVTEASTPYTWVPARNPAFAVRCMLHPRAQDLLDITPSWAERQAFSSYSQMIRGSCAVAPIRLRQVAQTRMHK